MQGEDFVYLNWAYAMAVGGVRIYVLQEDMPRARETIAKCLDGTYRRRWWKSSAILMTSNAPTAAVKNSKAVAAISISHCS
jgi:hypothetical protein